MLDEILDATRARVRHLDAGHLRDAASAMGPTRDFPGALAVPGLSVIAEIKRRSPSAGVIAAGLDPSAQAARYVAGGAAAISVLTEPDFFDGSLDDLRAVRSAVEVPVLRKDFILEPVQIWESRAVGADAVLLVVAALDDDTLRRLLDDAHAVGMTALVEVHTAAEAARAVAAGARVVGVNNRNLATLETDLGTAETLAPDIADAAVRIAESGVSSPESAARMHRAGYDAVLVGEALARSEDPAALVKAFRGAA